MNCVLTTIAQVAMMGFNQPGTWPKSYAKPIFKAVRIQQNVHLAALLEVSYS
jgi:hypothetical protein